MTDDKTPEPAEWFADGTVVLDVSLRLPTMNWHTDADDDVPEPQYDDWMNELDEAASEGVLLQYATIEDFTIEETGLLDAGGQEIER